MKETIILFISLMLTTLSIITTISIVLEILGNLFSKKDGILILHTI